ncbi:TlpA family protein disulfide reductase [Consotaella salsifontis]|uniref:Peroxiredoxin n=1 Tax=Consotaella salsifontis TaxID=1365950 RepID=A0A1T4MUB3_9HYPH|nr:TlpA disulfide reductase family protein [Consotaella salsifontis]SJZ70434.1 Peroxiredoxin [Consotaella salsifontis]
MRRLALSLALGALVLLAACDDKREEALRQPDGDRTAPEIVATDLDGSTVRLADLKGKVVLVNFWQASCGPCLAELPDFDAFYRANQNKGVAILAINMGESEDVVRATVRRLDLSMPLLTDRLDLTSARYNVLAAPTSFLIDGEGRLIERVNGPLNEKALGEKIGPLLSAPTAERGNVVG